MLCQNGMMNERICGIFPQIITAEITHWEMRE